MEDQHFELEVVINVFNSDTITASAKSTSRQECVDEFLAQIIDSTQKVIKKLDWAQKRVTSGISKDKKSFTPENEIQLTSVIMFKQLLENIS